MNAVQFIERELPYARERYLRLRSTVVGCVATDPVDTDDRRRSLAVYLDMRREQSIQLSGELRLLKALCRAVSEPNYQKECELLDAALWRLANGCDLAALELRYPDAFDRRQEAA